MMQTVSVDLPVVTLTGTPRRRGQIHGETLRGAIGEVMERWRDALSHASGLPADRYIERLLEETDFLPAIERLTPGLLDEVRGIADGANIPFRNAYAYQLVDEQWIFTRRLHEARAAAIPSEAAEHCTVLGVFDSPDGTPILAQNMDLPKFYDGAQTLLRVRDEDSDLEALILTVAGLIVTTGVNSRGVGCCCNTVSQLSSSTDGLPVAFIVRHVLAQESREDAVRFVTSIKQASGQNYTIGDPNGIASLECSANTTAAFTPLPNRVYHTNHPVVNDDLELRPPTGNGGAPDPIVGTQRTNTKIRFDAVAAALTNAEAPMSVDGVKAILSDPSTSVCAMRDRWIPSFTFGSVVMELSTPPVLNLAPGPPAVTAYARWTLA